MEYEEKEVMKDDCLNNARFFCVKIFQLRWVKIVIFILFIFETVLFITQTYIFLKTMNLQSLFHYGPCYIINFFMILTLYLASFICEKLVEQHQEIRSWAINSAGKEIENQITKDSNYINYCLCGYLILGLFSGLQFAIPKDDDKDLMFFIPLFDKYFDQNWSNILTLLYRVLCIPGVPVMFIPYCQVIFAITIVRYQLQMLGYYVANIDGTSCQKEIKKRIVFCVKRHAQLYCVSNTFRRRLLVLVILVGISGAIVFPTLLIFCYLTTASIQKYLRFVSSFLLAGVTFTHITHAGQLMESNSAVIFENLLNVKWYDWNKENKQIYLIFLTNAAKQIRVNFSQEISLNYEMGTAMMKAIYSFTSILYQFRKKA